MSNKKSTAFQILQHQPEPDTNINNSCKEICPIKAFQCVYKSYRKKLVHEDQPPRAALSYAVTKKNFYKQPQRENV